MGLFFGLPEYVAASAQGAPEIPIDVSGLNPVGSGVTVQQFIGRSISILMRVLGTIAFAVMIYGVSFG